MQDPRALANLKTLQSYRSWEQDGLRRSGYLIIVMSIPVILAPLFIFTIITLASRATTGAPAGAALGATVFAIYLAVAGGLMVISFLRLNAWRQAHAWTPPTTGEPLTR
jgi:hypothetical protein